MVTPDQPGATPPRRDAQVANPPAVAPPFSAANWSAPPQRRRPGRRCLNRRHAPWSRQISQVRHLHAETPRLPIYLPSRRPSVLPIGRRLPSTVALDAVTSPPPTTGRTPPPLLLRAAGVGTISAAARRATARILLPLISGSFDGRRTTVDRTAPSLAVASSIACDHCVLSVDLQV